MRSEGKLRSFVLSRAFYAGSQRFGECGQWQDLKYSLFEAQYLACQSLHSTLWWSLMLYPRRVGSAHVLVPSLCGWSLMLASLQTVL